MEVSGFQIKEALKMKNLELDAVRLQFDDSLHAFKDEKKMSPQEIMTEVSKLEQEIAVLQTAQRIFNLETIVKVGEATMPLEAAIKLVGGAGRSSGMWRKAAGSRRRRGYYNEPSLSRRADEEQAQPTVSRAEALQFAKEAEKFASQLRGAIAVGNTQKVDIDSVTPALLD